jgi:hypothetical protein
METFFKNVAYEDAENIEQASRLIFELRENRAALLQPYQVADDAELLARIKAGQLPEHPSYEHYLSARILTNTRESLRAELAAHLEQVAGKPASREAAVPSESVHHIELQEQLVSHYGERLDGAPQLLQDALALCFDNGLVVELRVASADEYAIHWLWGDAELSIDTAPLHPDVGSFPSHFHDLDGRIRPDPLTRPGRAPLANIQALIDALLVDPLLSA